MKNKIYLILTSIFIINNVVLSQNVPSYVPTNGLVGWWPFNGNANDASGNGHNGIINGVTPSINRFGVSNKAYSFDGINDYITIPNSVTSNIIGSYTINFWMYTTDTIPQPDGHEVIGDRDSSTFDFKFRLTYGIPQQPFLQNTYIQTCSNGNNSCSSVNTALPSISVWENYTIVYQSNTQVFSAYKNGIQIGSVQNAVFSSGNRQINLGRSLNPANINGNAFFNGMIDDIGVWNRALTQNEIMTLYLGCNDTITTQPSNQIALKGTNKNLSITYSGTGYNYQWQTNPIGCGWQSLANANQYSGVNTNSLTVNEIGLANHKQIFRVIVSKPGCADTSNIVTLSVSDVTKDSTDLLMAKDSITKLNQLLANKHDTLYVGSNITTDTLKISIRTGLSESSPILNNIKVYPNPAANVLNIQLEKPGNFIARLTGVTGQTIVSPTSGTIDISGLANGVYILTIYDWNNKLISTNKVSIIK